MKVSFNCCCGMDVHKDKICACILSGDGDEPQKIQAEFSAMNFSLKQMCSWLLENDCFLIAMESTGVYWCAVYEIIEEMLPDAEILLVNAYHMRNVPGRKSNVKDAEWIASLLRHGLLSKSFVPDKVYRTMREVSRLKHTVVRQKVSYSNRLEKFLQRHGFKLSSVVSNILGASGTKLLDTLAVKGSLTYTDVAKCCSSLLKASPDEIHLAVCGSLDISERKILSFILNSIRGLDEDIAELDELLAELVMQNDSEKLPILTSVPGINRDSATYILAEISGSPQIAFKNSSRLCSWAGLSPRNDESADKIQCRKIMPGNPYLKSILCQVAWASVRSRSGPYTAWFYKNRARLGSKKAIIAVARRILALIFSLLLHNELFDSNKIIACSQ